MISKPSIWSPKTPIKLVFIFQAPATTLRSLGISKSGENRQFACSAIQTKHFRFYKHRAYSPSDAVKLVQKQREELHQAHLCQLQASTSSWVIGIAVLVSLLCAGYTLSPSNEPDILEPKIVKVEEMSIKLPPGHLGNLTPEQEQKLREMWNIMFQLFGLIEPPAPPSTLATATQALNGSADSSTKKRVSSFFGRKSGVQTPIEVPQPSAAACAVLAGMSSSASDANEKHDLSKAFIAATANLTPAQIREAFWLMTKHDHPDALLLRFLRARKWDVHAAVIMSVSALNWRLIDAKVDSDVMFQGEQGMRKLLNSKDPQKRKLGKDFLDQLEAGKSFLQGRDKEGRPCCYVRVRMHRAGEQSEESLERFTVWTIETARLMLQPPVSTATIVFDMTGFGLQNMDYVPVKFMIRCFEANYPESLGLVLVHRAPWVFQGIWKVIRGWLDPVVAAKINFTNSAADLAAFLPENDILKELGGRNETTFKFIAPQPGEDEKLKDTQNKAELEKRRAEMVSEYEDVVRDWISLDQLDASPEREAKLRARREEVAAELTANYWELDPHIRARSVYDRTGAIEAPKTMVVSTVNAAGGEPKDSKLAVPVLPSSASVSGRTSTSSVDVFEDAQEDLD